jgi:hypothetical protein
MEKKKYNAPNVKIAVMQDLLADPTEGGSNTGSGTIGGRGDAKENTIPNSDVVNNNESKWGE